MKPEDLPPLEPESFTVSHTFDTHKGERQNHFVTMAFKAPPGASPELVHALSIKASERVTMAAIYHAIGRGQLSIEEANTRIDEMRMNHARLLEKALKDLKSSLEAPDSQDGPADSE